MASVKWSEQRDREGDGGGREGREGGGRQGKEERGGRERREGDGVERERREGEEGGGREEGGGEGETGAEFQLNKKSAQALSHETHTDRLNAESESIKLN